MDIFKNYTINGNANFNKVLLPQFLCKSIRIWSKFRQVFLLKLKFDFDFEYI